MASKYTSAKAIIRLTVEDPNFGQFSRSFLQAKQILNRHELTEETPLPFPYVTRFEFSEDYTFEAYRNTITLYVSYPDSEELAPANLDDLDEALRNLVGEVSYMKIRVFEIGFDFFYVEINSLNSLVPNLPGEKKVRNFSFSESVEEFLATYTLTLLIARQEPGAEFDGPDQAIEVSSNFYWELPEDVGDEEAQRLILERLSLRGQLFLQAKGVVDGLQLHS